VVQTERRAKKDQKVNDLATSGLRRKTYKNPLFTAVPSGRHWQVKCFSPDGEITLLGRFDSDSRLSALGASVLMAAQMRGVVLP
jgi:hypothetical protein